MTWQERRFLRKVGLNIRRLREAKGYSQAKMYVLTGIAQSSICNYERGDRAISADRLYRLAAALGCRVEEFFYDQDNSQHHADHDGGGSSVPPVCGTDSVRRV